MPFQRGHKKLGGRKAGKPNRKTERRREAETNVMISMCEVTKLTPEEMAELTPLNVMLLAMVARWRMGDLAGAVACASAAAPYCHARLSSSEVRVTHDLSSKTDRELLEEAQALEERMRLTIEHQTA